MYFPDILLERLQMPEACSNRGGGELLAHVILKGYKKSVVSDEYIFMC